MILLGHHGKGITYAASYGTNIDRRRHHQFLGPPARRVDNLDQFLFAVDVLVGQPPDTDAHSDICRVGPCELMVRYGIQDAAACRASFRVVFGSNIMNASPDDQAAVSTSRIVF